MVKLRVVFIILLSALVSAISITNLAYCQDDDSSRQILKQGLLGAGVGAISSSASGGNAGQGALIGAGTSVIGSALLDALTTPSRSSSRRRAAPPPDEDYYYASQPEDYYVEEEPPQESSSQKILKQGLVGAGTGALASGMSGGDAGKGALIGAGTGVIGNALLDTITSPPQQRRGRVYRRIPQQQQQPVQQGQSRVQAQNIQVSEEPASGVEGRKKVIKKYDSNGKLVSEEEIYY